MTTTPHAIPPIRSPRKAVIASGIGTTIEYYDFTIYGLASSLLFATLFFPTSDPATGTIIALSTFGVGFVVRPLGGVIFGHLGDRVGRRTVLVVTLLLMGGATFAVGLLPTYATLGVWAPVLLLVLRVLQGLSVGGEFAGAMLMTIEHAEKHRRGFRGALAVAGSQAGLIISNVVFLAVLALPRGVVLDWAWRVPFLLSALLVVVGLTVRLTLEESPEFVEARRSGLVRRLPAIDVLRSHGRDVLLVVLCTIGGGVSFTILTVFVLSYGPRALGISGSEVLGIMLPASVVLFAVLPTFGWLGDRFGPRPVFVIGAIAMIVAPYIWFTLLDSRNYLLMGLGFVVVFASYAANYAVFPIFFSSAFPPSLRFSGICLGFTFGTILGNAFAPTLAAVLQQATGGWLGVALYMSAAALISLFAGLALRQDAAELGSIDGPERAASRTLVTD